MKPVEINVNFLYAMETSENRRCFQREQKGISTRNGLKHSNIGESGSI